jgi:hypothetical protein
METLSFLAQPVAVALVVVALLLSTTMGVMFLTKNVCRFLCCADTSNLYLSFQSMQWLRRPRLSYPKIQEALSAKELEFRLVDPRAGHFGWAHT